MCSAEILHNEDHTMKNEKIRHVRIVGTGLIGTSIGLALAQRGVSLELDDKDPNSLQLALDLLGPAIASEKPELVVIATPPESAFDALKREFLLNPQSTFIDVSSVKTNLQLKVDSLPEIAKQFVGTHPMSGRESSGPGAAQSDLFEGRAWFVTPGGLTNHDALNLVRQFVESLGATSYLLTPQEHDELMARISHLPQLLSTLLAVTLSEKDKGVDLAGQGLRDMTRIAGSDGDLWSQILMENQQPILQAMDGYLEKLQKMRTAISQGEIIEIKRFFADGNLGKTKVSGKHGAKPRNYSHLLIVIKDEPGALSKLFNECAKLNANIEDLSIEHSPGQLTGLITLAFSPEDASRVKTHLTSQDWKVHQR